jgi:hypothetical protein
VTKLVFKSLSVKYGDGAVAPSPPGRAPGPPRAPAAAFASPAVSGDDLLDDLGGEPGPPPRAAPHAPVASLPPIEVEEEATAVSAFPAAPALPARAAAVPMRPPLAGHRPHTTLVSNKGEADYLRQQIATPGIPDVEMDLEELEELEAQSTHAKLVPGAPRDTAVPEPSFRQESPQENGSGTAVEVPIDIEVSPGTNRIRLNLRLVLNLRRRR